MPNGFDVLQERGFIEQTSDEPAIRKLLENERVTFYSGFDPTADSLTVGHFVPIMALAHLQRTGHRPIVLVGGGTGFVGDPTDKTELRQMMPRERIEYNCACFKRQFAKFIDFSEGKAIMADNADWLLDLKYIPFIREYGVHFSVNKMLTADAYRARFERGLTFFEFNYMLMQAYDFLELYRRYNCKLQVGGNDQWSNILAGADLIRRVENARVECMTYTLLTTGDGKKMGKSQKGAVWLDREKTSPYEFFQYWRNVDDADVLRFLKLLTFLPISEIDEMSKWRGGDLNRAKEILAFELTKIIHGEEDAVQSMNAARELFGGGASGGSVPETKIQAVEWNGGMNIIDVLSKTGLIASRGEGRRLIEQGGVRVNDQKVDRFDHIVIAKENSILIQKGKKIFHRVKITDFT
ncbi:MAG: tyrosine--tRNA ligase [Clostridiales bacterium]|jgi:tyrosyl-tRNA synthetase|nr:tyrosine--tRNA ligase [Clostridiales bacterium]